MNAYRIGIDLGGTKIEGVLLDGTGHELMRKRLPTPRLRYKATLDCIAALVETLQNEVKARDLPVGIGIPGSISPVTGLVRNANSTWLNGKAFGRDISARLDREVRVANDANCLALSEVRDGAAQGAGSVFAVILGTGVGGGLVLGGHIVSGANGLAGEWGHVPLTPNQGPLCFCGRRGCIERWLAGPALVEAYEAGGGGVIRGVEEISRRAGQGDELALEILTNHLNNLGQALGMIVNIVDPEVIILGGGLSLLPGLAENLPGAIAPHIFAAAKDKVRADVRLAKWGDSSGVRGAAQLWSAEK